MENLIRTITMTGQLPKECFEQEEFAGNAELTLNDGRKIVGLAQISLPEGKLRLTPSNPLPESLDAGRVNGLGFDETELNLRMSLPTIDVFFWIQKARLDLNYATSISMDWPLEYRFASCILGPVKVPNKFASAIFGFENMRYLIGASNFHDWFSPYGLEGGEEVCAFPPADKAREVRSAQLGMNVELRVFHKFGFTSEPSKSIQMSERPISVARFHKSECPNAIRGRLFEFITFASLLDGEPIGFKFVTLKDVDSNAFRFAMSFSKSGRRERDRHNLGHEGVLLDTLSYFDEFAKISQGHGALATIADFSLNKEDGGDIRASLVLLSSAAEVLYKHIKGTSGNDMPETKRFLDIFKEVQPLFLDPIPEKWAETLVRIRNTHVHERLDMFGDESLGDRKIEKILRFTQVLHDILRAYAMLNCGMPRNLILKALRGSDPGIDFYKLRLKHPDRPMGDPGTG